MFQSYDLSSLNTRKEIQMEIKVQKPEVKQDPTFSLKVIPDLGGGALLQVTRTDLTPNENNTLLRLKKDGSLERVALGPNFREHFQVDKDNRIIVANPTPVS